jgi:hypothetical protein
MAETSRSYRTSPRSCPRTRLASPQVAGLFLSKDEVNLPSPKFSGTAGFSWTLPVSPLNGPVVLNMDYFRTGKFGGQLNEAFPVMIW